MKYPLQLFSALLLLGAHNIAAATTVDNLTFKQLTVIAFKQNLELQIQEKQTQGQMTGEGIAFTELLPSMALTSARYETLQNTVAPAEEQTSYATSVVLSQPVYQPGLWANWRKSQLSSSRADSSLTKQRQTLLFQLKQAWYNLLREQVLYNEAVDSLARLKQHRKNAQEFYGAGKIWRNDVLQAHVRVSKGEQDIYAAHNRLELAKSTINILMNRDLTTPFNAQGEMQHTPFNRNFKDLIKQALTNRLELKQSDIDIELAQKDLEIAEAKLWPTVSLSLSSGVSANAADYNPAALETTVSLNMSWNFWQWGQTNKEIDVAELGLSVEKLRAEQQKVLVMSQVQSAFLTVMEAQKSLNVSEQALKQAEENFRVSQIRYKEQLGSSNDVLDAQDLLTSTKVTRVSALSRYLSALAELDLAIGAPAEF